MSKSSRWKVCSECGKKYKRGWGGTCYNCYIKKHKRLGYGQGYSFKKALEKTYEIRGYLDKNRYMTHAQCGFPSVLAGCKIKIQLVEKPKEEDFVIPLDEEGKVIPFQEQDKPARYGRKREMKEVIAKEGKEEENIQKQIDEAYEKLKKSVK